MFFNELKAFLINLITRIIPIFVNAMIIFKHLKTKVLFTQQLLKQYTFPH